MKCFFCSGLMLAIVNLCAAQTPVPELGDFSGPENKITECPFDKEANAAVLIDEATANYDDERKLIVTRRIRLKVLKQKGLDYANIEIGYYSANDAEFVSDIDAYTWNGTDGSAELKKLPSSSIYRQKVNERYSKVTFAMPDVKVGSIIEYRYTTTSKNYNYLDDWYFQRELPVMHSSFSLVIPPNYEFAYQVHKSEQLPITIKSEKGSGKIYFEMKNIAGLRDEPFMDAEKDYLQHVEFQLSGYQGHFGGTTRFMTTWDEVARELMTNQAFGLQLNKNVPNTEALLLQVNIQSNPYDKMVAVYHSVYKTISWNGRGGIGTDDGVKEAWEKKKGSSAQINLLLINLLKEAGLEVYPLLVSERGHGKVNENYPFIDQFNKVMAYVVIGDNKYVLDAAGPYTPPFMIPFSVINTRGFIVNRKKGGPGGIITLTETNRTDNNLVIIRAKLDDDGTMTGDAKIQSSEYARLIRIRAYERDKERFRENYFTSYQAGLQIDSLVVNNLEKDSLPLEQECHFVVPPTVSGDYKLINLNLFSGIPRNPFISDIRFTNIDYGCLQRYTVIEEIQLPPTLKVESLPKNVRMIMPDTSITLSRMVVQNDKVLSVRYTIQTRRSVFTADEYGYVKDFYKKMADIMNEQVVLRKKE